MQEFKGRVAGVKVDAVDTTGAGDAFVAGILWNLASDLTLYKVHILPFSFSFLFLNWKGMKRDGDSTFLRNIYPMHYNKMKLTGCIISNHAATLSF